MNNIINPAAASSAYMNTANIKGSGVGSENVGGVKFSDYLEDKARDSLETIRASEVMSAKAITGDADITQVVEAVTAAEVTLQTIVAVRDRVISAYQEIMRMPI